MRYLVKAKPKESMTDELMEEIRNETLGKGSVAFGEYIKNMREARLLDDGTVCWIEVCFCHRPLNEELHYWKKYFDQITTENAQDPKRCKDANGMSVRACFECSCTTRLEKEMSGWGKPFLPSLA